MNMGAIKPDGAKQPPVKPNRPRVAPCLNVLLKEKLYDSSL